MKKITTWLIVISVILFAVNITMLVAGNHIISALENGNHNISAGTLTAVISLSIRVIHLGAAVACGILAISVWKCSKPKFSSIHQVKGE